MSNIFKFRISPKDPWQTLPVIKGQDGKDGEMGPAGPQGEPGKDGAQGPAGKDGTDGKTPVKGVDYFTEADIQEIASRVEPQDVDLSEYAKKSEIPDTSGFTTEEDVNALINTALGVIENGSY
ncbi:MAG: collagen-like protein [Paludibacteraceae bacterium]|nr:collagen-like protein [Paludibacteraceae bacterium]